MGRRKITVEPGAILDVARTLDGDGYVGCYGARVRVEGSRRDDKGRPAILVGIYADHDAGALPWVVRTVQTRDYLAGDLAAEGLEGQRGVVTVQLVQADHRHYVGAARYAGLAEECPFCAQGILENVEPRMLDAPGAVPPVAGLPATAAEPGARV